MIARNLVTRSLLFAILSGLPLSAQINFVQRNHATSNPSGLSLRVTFPAAQKAGNLNIVAVGWNDTRSAVSSVVDSRGNSYILAVGPTLGSALTQSIMMPGISRGATTR